jgi:hypothetical protein
VAALIVVTGSEKSEKTQQADLSELKNEKAAKKGPLHKN